MMRPARWRHHGQHGTGDVEGAEYVGVELPFDLSGVVLLEGAELAVAGIVDQHVYPAVAAYRQLHRALGLRGVGDVQGDRQDVIAVAFVDGGQRRGVAPCCDHAVAGSKRSSRYLVAQPAGGARNQPDLLHVVLQIRKGWFCFRAIAWLRWPEVNFRLWIVNKLAGNLVFDKQ